LSTGVALISVDAEGEKQIIVAPGANDEFPLDRITSIAPEIARAKVLLTQFELPMGSVREALTVAHRAGVMTVLDPAPPAEGSRELLPMVHLIRPNSNEAHALTGIDVHDRKSAGEAGRRLIDMGARQVVTQAGRGNLLIDSDGEEFFPFVPIDSVDATGAGDAFVAALAVMQHEGRDMRESVRFASAAAALATTRIGAIAGLPTRDEVESLLARQ
jgi:ribokinase